MIRDVFLCHASEDKHSIVRSLHEGLTKSGITCWLDEAEVRWGDSIVEKVQEGLRESQFVIVVLSKTFLAKPWPRRELAAALSVEASTGGVRVLPLLAGDEHEKRAILKEFPLLADKLYLVWDGDPSRVIQAMVRRLQKNRGSEAELPPPLNVPKVSSTYCIYCGAGTGNPTKCLANSSHSFVAGRGNEYCIYCGAGTGNPTKCLANSSHSFVAGRGNEYCIYCGAGTGNPTKCLANSSHSFVAGRGNEYCIYCGAGTGNPTKCEANAKHSFVASRET